MNWEENSTWKEKPSLTIFNQLSLDLSSALKTNQNIPDECSSFTLRLEVYLNIFGLSQNYSFMSYS